ncbi:MAG TPA: DegT/DnrJ/EryC1/StrS family aminotransferase [Candidatus Omnitrophica bacterium]|nr:DegT/DnrJ/EryC1/StrS family aminotransferase [Candidatus Omnitrophota bacterium]
MIDLFYPYVPKEAIDAVTDVLRSRFIGQGPKVDQFEKDFNKFFHLNHSVALNSGTSALDTAYDLVGLKRGDEVICTPLTCTATNLPLLRRGVKIIWADVDPDTLCIDYNDINRKITDKTKAIVQVHLGGIKAGMGKYNFFKEGVFTQRKKIPIISDACQALGIFSGDMTACSFQAIKHITTGDGGMIVLNNSKDEKDAKMLRWFGIDREKKIANNWQAYRERKMTFDIDLPGTKRHMTDISAAMGIAALKHYREVIKHRKKIFNIYRRKLCNIPGVMRIVDGEVNTYWLATLLVENRDGFARMLFDADVDTNVVQVRNDIYHVFGGKRENLMVMNSIEENYISIPLGMHVSEENAEFICQKIKGGW